MVTHENTQTTQVLLRKELNLCTAMPLYDLSTLAMKQLESTTGLQTSGVFNERG